jgi:hypothetical protein
MTKRNAVHIPDELLRAFGRGVDHFEYDDGNERAVAVFADGRREEFSTHVTPEMIEADREAWRRRVEEAGGIVRSSVLRVDVGTNLRGFTFNGES